MATGTIRTDIRETLSINDVVLSSAIDTTGSNTLTVIRRGNVVTVSGTLKLATASAWQNLTLITSGLPRPVTGQNGGLIAVLDDATFPNLSWYANVSGGMTVYVRGTALTGKTIILTGSYVL